MKGNASNLRGGVQRRRSGDAVRRRAGEGRGRWQVSTPTRKERQIVRHFRRGGEIHGRINKSRREKRSKRNQLRQGRRMASLKEERIERREVAREERKEVQIVREVREIRIDIANEVQGGSRLSKQKMTNRENADLKRCDNDGVRQGLRIGLFFYATFLLEKVMRLQMYVSACNVIQLTTLIV